MTADVYAALDALGISYERYDHPAVATVEAAREHTAHVPGADTKNLFLRDKKGKRHLLLTARADAEVDLNALSEQLGVDRLSFASPERLERFLGVTQGSVSPLALLNDQEGVVEVFVDEGLLDYERISMHPNINTTTLVVSRVDFKKFLDSTGHRVEYIGLQY